MDTSFEGALIRYLKFWEQLTDESVEEYRELASPSIRYRCPLMDVEGVDATVAGMHKWFANSDDLQLEINGYARDGRLVLAHWRMTFRVKKAPKKLWEVYAVSKMVFDDAGKVADVIDYWDASPMLESIPLMGKAVTLVKKLAFG
jgi:hypothetical protein